MAPRRARGPRGQQSLNPCLPGLTSCFILEMLPYAACFPMRNWILHTGLQTSLSLMCKIQQLPRTSHWLGRCLAFFQSVFSFSCGHETAMQFTARRGTLGSLIWWNANTSETYAIPSSGREDNHVHSFVPVFSASWWSRGDHSIRVTATGRRWQFLSSRNLGKVHGRELFSCSTYLGVTEVLRIISV